ncbi:phospho-N-acetylmuramoyl-pentapeptide-transferase [Domibacillus enclensis]|uniref:Phospho-N-acetylmuramoyl-pentapeptide-transferase n=1 Tax=Domibacillus enclensis TaxID=1017273 RepID=A0A1N6U9D4_9BACI|nr:phospho-N-acetylmuramoyl-pentapeptide-transferase [Domibacillus enclensis]OXS78469.1 phospho-N-acetylmuramoyl-pentapeptide-transferase [Domibacillus enclensis]SIQ62278.1 Phospho-N-acetylmuramoyl-pentapeptide-transferase [Domibacillus enclensis]
MSEWQIGLIIAVSFLITVMIAPLFIPFLRRLKFGQSIREEGPQSHQQKSGTPTMGGLVFLLSIVITTLFFVQLFGSIGTETALLLLVTIGFGLLGFLDDFIKVVMKRNLGLTSLQKLIGQIVISIIFYVIYAQQGLSTELSFGFFSLDLGILYALFVLFWLVGFSNAVNLTDGLDGLVSGTASVAFGAYAVIAWSQGLDETAIFAFSVVGAIIGFLVFNAYPAHVFMGDTGSLALGGAIAVLSILTKFEFLLLLIGIVFVAETLSVILQVWSFKTRGKRIFRMSPLHHHFELGGWSEWRVVVTFWSVGIVAAAIGVWIGVWR